MEMLQNMRGILILLAAGIIMFAVYYAGQVIARRKILREQKESDVRAPRSRDTIYLEDKIRTLTLQINNLNELNMRYFTFSQKLAEAVTHLYSSLIFKEVVSTVVYLVKEIINTDTIEIYILDTEKNLLKRIWIDEKPGEEVSYAIGEGLVGSAARHHMVTTMGETYKAGSSEKEKTKLRVAAPILFKDQLLGVIGIGEIRKITGNERAFLKIIADIASVVLINQTYMKEWKDEAITDALTGLYNRRYFYFMTMKYVEKSMREDIPIAICLFDIDNFKHYNDTNGHQEGDRLSELLIRFSRKKSIIARYGGEEFIAMLPEITKQDALVYAERVREEVANYPFLHGDKQPLGFVSISGGIAGFPDDAGTMEKVIHLADKALYKAKKEGKNRMTVHQISLLSEEGV